MTSQLKSIDAQSAARLMEAGALMVDVREGNEYAGGHIGGSQNAALSALEASDLALAPGQAVVFFCAGGNRTTVHAARLAAKAGSAEAYVMAGGVAEWRRAGLPLERGQTGGGQGGFFSRVFGG